MIVCINKMDEKSVKYNEERFVEIKKVIKKYLFTVGFNDRKMKFIPVSGWTGDNLVEKGPEEMDWY